MNTVIKKTNDCLLDSFSETFNILDATIKEFKIYVDENNLVVIDIDLKLLHPRGMNLKLSFYGIKEYAFYWKENYAFYDIGSYKFFKVDDLFYISLDPEMEGNNISQNDNDFILCENIEGSLL